MDAPDYRSLPEDLPVPQDDGAAAHLTGAEVPSVELAATDGETVDLADVSGGGPIVVYVYPMTGIPGRALPEGWDAMPGARGCTPQSCAFRDHWHELSELGAEVFGLSAQITEEQREFAAREKLPYRLLSDCAFELASRWRLPTFDLDGVRYYSRLTFVASAKVVTKVFYPVFPPDRNAGDTVAWLRARRT